MSSFLLDPYIGALPVTFNMSPEDVSHILGAPDSVRLNKASERDERRGPVAIRYSSNDHKVVEISFLPTAHVFLQGEDLFRNDNAIGFVSQYDRPLEFVGFVVFLDLGITLAGFHDKDDSQKAISAFRKGRWDKFRDRLSPLHEINPKN
jgi:hypothetical protein